MKFALTSLLLAAAASTVSSDTIVDLAVATEDLSTLVDLVTSAGLVDTLSAEGPYTVFAPTNDAFAAVPADVLDALGANTELLTSVLTYHALAGNVTSSDLVAGPITMVSGEEATITLDPAPMINQANIVTADIMASNGVVHLIDAVILPEGFEVPPMDNTTAAPTPEPTTSSATSAKSVMGFASAAAVVSMLF